jgi:hypothetical protein
VSGQQDMGFLKVLSSIFLSWSNKLRGRDVLKDLGALKRDSYRKIEYVGVHCVDMLLIVGFCEICVV